MTNERREFEQLEEVEEIETEELFTEEIDEFGREPEEDFSDESKFFVSKMKRNMWIVLFSMFLLVITRFFPKYADFNVVTRSPVFMLLFVITLMVALYALYTINNVKEKLHTKQSMNQLKVSREVFDIFTVVPVFMAVITLLNISMISPASVTGQSMEPTFYEGDNILVWHMNEDIELFDVVIIKVTEEEYYIKRVIGMPGDIVKIDHNQIYINGELIEQEFLLDDNGSMINYTYCTIHEAETCTYTVPDNQYFVLGDNRENSVDSRSTSLGYIKEEDIYGEVIFTFHNLIN